MVAAGCLGGSTGGSPAQSSQKPETRVEITYFGAVHRSWPATVPLLHRAPAIGDLPRGVAMHASGSERSPDPLPGRDPAGRALLRRPLRTHATSPRRAWLILQQRELSCTPPRGGYSDPAAACGALAGYARLAKRPNRAACSCPPQIWASRAVGIYRGRPLALDLSVCASCGLGASAGADLEILLPHLPTG